MIAQFPSSIFRTAFVAAAAVVGTVFGVLAQSNDVAMIFLKDGSSSEAEIVSVGAAEVTFRLSGVASIQKMPYTKIDYIEFAAPEAWIQTVELFEKGEYEKVIGTFKEISTQKSVSTGYPAPGNFATQAERRLIDCYRHLHNPGEVAYLSKRMEWDKLPPADRELREIVKCWELVGDGKREEAEQAIAKTAASMADTNPAGAELNFLLALNEEGKIPAKAPETEAEIKAIEKIEEEAVVQYGRSFGIDAAADPGLAAAAMKQAIERLVGKEEREAELKALVHLYAGLHGDGKLWADAGEYLEKLHADKLEVFSAVADVKTKKKPAGSGKIQARYVRIEQVASEPSFLTMAEVQVMSGQANIAFTGKAKQSSNGKINDREYPPRLAIDGDTKSGFQVGTFSRTEKEKEPWWELDLGTMKLIEEINIYNCKNNRGEFVKPPGTLRVILFDGGRQEVFKSEDQPAPEPKLTIKVGDGGDSSATPDDAGPPADEPKPADGDQ